MGNNVLSKTITTKDHCIYALEYELQSVDRLHPGVVEDIIIGLSRGYRKLESTGRRYFKQLSFYERATYIDDLIGVMSDYLYDKITKGMRDDELTEEFIESLTGTFIEWYDLLDMVTHSNSFDAIYAYVRDNIVADDSDISSFKVYQNKVLIEYGQKVLF